MKIFCFLLLFLNILIPNAFKKYVIRFLSAFFEFLLNEIDANALWVTLNKDL